MNAKSTYRSPKALVDSVLELVVFPPAALKVIQLIDDPEAHADAIADALSLDPALAAQVLRIANSAHYSGHSAVDSVSRAITVLGRGPLRDIVLGASAVSAFDALDIEAVSIVEFWQHSIYCGALAAEIAKLGRKDVAAAAFTAGLMHDLGQLMLFIQQPNTMREVLMEVALNGDEIRMCDVEQEFLGFSHCDVGRELALAWELPQSLGDCLYQHHNPDFSSPSEGLVSVVHIANSCAVLMEIGESDLAAASDIDPRAWASARIAPADIPGILDSATERYLAMKAMLLD